jgi:endogenous inhibitor of DNA gyrase (YacG/DUF329 family)
MIRPQTCPICDTELVTHAATKSPLFPFCSERCKLIDLGRWLDGKYQVPVVEEDGDESAYAGS